MVIDTDLNKPDFFAEEAKTGPFGHGQNKIFWVKSPIP